MVSAMAVERRGLFGLPQAFPREYGKDSSAPCPALSCFQYLQMKASIRLGTRLVYEVEGHTQTGCHYGFPGLFHLLQSSIDAYVGGMVIVRDSRKFLFCKMSGYSKMLIRDTHKNIQRNTTRSKQGMAGRTRTFLHTSRQSDHSSMRT